METSFQSVYTEGMNMQAVGAYLQEQRKASGLTQDEVGHRLGVAGRTVSDWEVGRYVPSFDRMARLVRIIGAEMERATRLLLAEPDKDERALVDWADTEEKRAILLRRVLELADGDPEFQERIMVDLRRYS